MSAIEKVRRVFLCRHGETEANIQKIYCGGARESPLTAEGRRQAVLLGKALKEYYKFHGRIIIASPRGRVKETAKPIAENLEPKPLILTMEGLREMEMGQWCGKNEKEIIGLFPEEYEEWGKDFVGPNFRFPGGESIKEFQERISKCFTIVKKLWLDNKRKDNSDLIIIAHSGTNMAILVETLKVEMITHGLRIFGQDNACLNIIAFREKSGWRPKVQIALINSTHHLDMDLESRK